MWFAIVVRYCVRRQVMLYVTDESDFDQQIGRDLNLNKSSIFIIPIYRTKYLLTEKLFYTGWVIPNILRTEAS